jgi:hypothetical protein
MIKGKNYECSDHATSLASCYFSLLGPSSFLSTLFSSSSIPFALPLSLHRYKKGPLNVQFTLSFTLSLVAERLDFHRTQQIHLEETFVLNTGVQI